MKNPMNNRPALVLTILLVSFSLHAKSSASLEPLAPLHEYESVKAFENAITNYREDCLTNSVGDSSRVRCYVERNLWQREIKIAYEKLSVALSEQQHQILETNQAAWLAYFETQQKLDASLMPREYRKPGTMYLALRAQYIDDTRAPLMKQRALHLINWYKNLHNKF